MAEVLTRQDVDVTETWNLESIYATNEAWEEEFESVKVKMGESVLIPAIFDNIILEPDSHSKILESYIK